MSWIYDRREESDAKAQERFGQLSDMLLTLWSDAGYDYELVDVLVEECEDDEDAHAVLTWRKTGTDGEFKADFYGAGTCQAECDWDDTLDFEECNSMCFAVKAAEHVAGGLLDDWYGVLCDTRRY